MSNTELRAVEAIARTHINAAIDALLKPFTQADGNCRRPDASNPAELAAYEAIHALSMVTSDTVNSRGPLARLERATR